MGNILTSAGNLLTSCRRTIKYGKQVGKVSKSGVSCYAKKEGITTKYTTLNHVTGDVKKQKFLHKPSENYMYGQTYDAQNNLVETFEQVKERKGYGLAADNKFAKVIRNVRETYNKFGQKTSSRDITVQPTKKAGWLEINSCVNGNTSGKCSYVG